MQMFINIVLILSKLKIIKFTFLFNGIMPNVCALGNNKKIFAFTRATMQSAC